MQEFREKTAPLVEYYAERGVLAKIDGDRTPNEVFEQICETVEGLSCQ